MDDGIRKNRAEGPRYHVLNVVYTPVSLREWNCADRVNFYKVHIKRVEITIQRARKNGRGM